MVLAVVAIAATGAVVVLPAVLASLGPRVEKFVLWHHTPKPVGEGAWHRIALFVMRRPVWVGLTVVALLLALGAPFLGVKFGLPDDRVLPKGAVTRRSADVIRAEFASQEQAGVGVAAPGLSADDPQLADLEEAAAQRAEVVLGAESRGRRRQRVEGGRVPAAVG